MLHAPESARFLTSFPSPALPACPWQVRKYLGAYFTHLGGKVDAVVFSAGESGTLGPPFPAA